MWRPPCRTFLTTASSSSSNSYDVVVVGGGVVGSALACALKHAQPTSELSVALVDREGAPGAGSEANDEAWSSSSTTPPDARVSTLTPATAAFLRRVGAWDAVSPPVSAAFAGMQVWDEGQGGYGGAMRFGDLAGSSSSPSSSEGIPPPDPPLGYVVENAALRDALRRRAADLGCAFESGAVADVALPRPPIGITRPAAASTAPLESDAATPWGRVSLASGRTLSAPLIVGADGARSLVRRLAGIRCDGTTYDQRAVTATVSVRASPDAAPAPARAYQRFLEAGDIIALLPVRSGFYNVVWSTHPDRAEALAAAPPAAFAAAVNGALGFHGGAHAAAACAIDAALGAMADAPRPPTNAIAGWAVGEACAGPEPPPVCMARVGPPPRAFPLARRHARTYWRRGLCLIGDAAHTIHPLAGQGVNLGFGDAEALREEVGAALLAGGCHHADEVLGRYGERRRRENGAMMAALEAVRWVYASQQQPIAWARTLGMDLLNLPAAAGPLRRAAVAYASANARLPITLP